MTITTSVGRVQYNGNDVTTAFATNFTLIASSQVSVYVDTTLQTETTHYTVSGVGSATATVTIITPPATGEVVTLRLNMPLTQTSDLVNGNAFNANVVEQAFDLGTLQDQATDEKATRSLRAPETVTTSFDGELPTVTADYIIGVNSGGTGFEMLDPATVVGVKGDTGDTGATGPAGDMTSDSTATLTNKTFDANGTGNSLSNVDVADISNGTDGELITWDASGAPTTVATGTATHVLTSNGAGTAPTFQAAAGGGGQWTEISSATASTVASVEFTSFSTAFRLYKVIISDLISTSNTSGLRLTTSQDGGSTYASSGYTYLVEARHALSSTAHFSNSGSGTEIRLTSNSGNFTFGNVAGEVGASEITFSHEDDTFHCHATTWMSGEFIGYAVKSEAAGTSTANVDGIKFAFDSGNISTGTFTLYGLT